MGQVNATGVTGLALSTLRLFFASFAVKSFLPQSSQRTAAKYAKETLRRIAVRVSFQYLEFFLTGRLSLRKRPNFRHLYDE